MSLYDHKHRANGVPGCWKCRALGRRSLSKTYALRLPPSLYRRILVKAKRANMNFSSYTRSLYLADLKKGKRK